MRLLPLHASMVHYDVEEATELPGSEWEKPTMQRSIIGTLKLYEWSITGIGRR